MNYDYQGMAKIKKTGLSGQKSKYFDASGRFNQKYTIQI